MTSTRLPSTARAIPERRHLAPPAGGEIRLVDVMTARQRWIFRALVTLWLGTLGTFWQWWLGGEHWASVPGMIVNSLLLVWATVLPGWFFFFVGRMKRPDRRGVVPVLRVALVVTKAPSEPWPLVRETLEACLSQRFPYPYDTWLADEDPSQETLAWCRARGVAVSCRKGVAAYHRPTWPRRTKCKEGNLAYFYDRWGYRDYDVVAQLDADHVPAPAYLAAMVRPFADPRVGYAAAPSICDRNVGESWVVRARLFVEATLHGALQAGYNQHYAPLCIGSHYAVRTAALREVGGLGPELAEDHTTTLALNAAGWEGVFAFDAEAHGDGAGSFVDSMTQELQWSRSLAIVLLTVTPRHWRGLTPRKKVQFGFAQAWYPLYALQMLVAHLLPPLALLTHQPWVRVDLPTFFLRAVPVTLSCVVATAWVRRQGWLRPSSGRLITWETYLFQFARWPWVLLAVAQAVVGWLLGREFTFKVTPKGLTDAKSLPLATIVPYLIIAAVSAGVALAVREPGPAAGYYFFSLLNATIYLALSAAIVGLHVRENRPRLTVPVIRFVGAPIVAITGTAALVAAAWAADGRRAIAIVIAGSTLGRGPLAPFRLPDGVAPPLVFPAISLALAALCLLPLLRGHGRHQGFAWPRPALQLGCGALLVATLVGLPGPWSPVSAQPSAAAVGLATAIARSPVDVAMPPPAPVVEPARPAATATTAPIVAAPATLTFDAGTRFFGAYDPTRALLDGGGAGPDFAAELLYTDLSPAAIARLGGQLDAIRRAGRTPVVTIEPLPLVARGLSEADLLDDLAAGRYDAEFGRIADIFRAYHGQIVVRFAHEMEIANLYPWHGEPTRYIAAYRHVHALLQGRAGGGLVWVWSPAGNREAAAYYPGDDVVDVVGITLLGAALYDTLSSAVDRRSFTQLMDEKWGRARAWGKPVIIAELGISASATEQTAWLAGMFRTLDNYPELRGITYFNDYNAINRLVADPPNFRITARQWVAAIPAAPDPSGSDGPR